MGSMNTMSLIAETFVSLTEHEPPEKIAVSDIVAASGKNAKPSTIISSTRIISSPGYSVAI